MGSLVSRAFTAQCSRPFSDNGGRLYGSSNTHITPPTRLKPTRLEKRRMMTRETQTQKLPTHIRFQVRFPSIMKITVPDDCGNSPRNALVSQFAVDWATGKTEDLKPVLSDTLLWETPGESESNSESSFLLSVREVEIFTAINHGRFSSCNGRILTDSGRIDFCHIFQFSGVAKTAKIVHIRTYLVRSSAGH